MSCESIKQLLDPQGTQVHCFSNSTVAEENKRKFVINKPANLAVCKVKVDGCLISEQHIRKCDYLFEVATDPKEYLLVELKGSDLNGAVEQLLSTYDRLASQINARPEQFRAFVVSSVVPKSNSAFRTNQQRLMKNRKLHLERGSIQHHVHYK
jgi:hypothetical protein